MCTKTYGLVLLLATALRNWITNEIKCFQKTQKISLRLQRHFARNYLKSFNITKHGAEQEPTDEEIDQLLLEANRLVLYLAYSVLINTISSSHYFHPPFLPLRDSYTPSV